MSSRMSSLASVCLRCQTQLARRHRVWNPLNVFAQSSERRHQSTAAVLAYDPEHESPTIETSPPKSDGSSGQAEPEDSPNRQPEISSSSNRSIRYRKWRPSTAEGLGVNVLGKPAEVLILPTRKRKIAELVPKEGEDGKSADTQDRVKSISGKGKKKENQGVQSSLDSELKPLSMTDAFSNIESVRMMMSNDTGQFSQAEWDKHVQTLSDGFTKLQLDGYLSKSGYYGQLGTQNAKGGHESKKSLAGKIMSHVWNWSREQGRLNPDQKTLKRTFNGMKLNYILRYQKQSLAQLSDTLGVQIDIFKKKNELSVKGPAKVAADAMNRVGQMVNNVHNGRVEVPKYLLDLLADQVKLQMLLKRLMHKHRLIIQKSDFDNEVNVLQIAGPVTSGPDLVLRDLLLLAGRYRRLSPSSMLERYPDDSLIPAPFWANDLPHWVQQDQSWYRHISINARPELNDATRNLEEIRRSANIAARHQRFTEKQWLRFNIVPDSLRTEHSVQVGQVLFENGLPDEEIRLLTAKGHRSNVQSTLVLYQPLLPQILARQDFTPVKIKMQKKNTQSLLLRLTLRPVQMNAALPPIEIVLSGLKASLGLGQKLTIKAASIILDDWRHNLLLPDQPLDVIMLSQSKIDLLGTSNSKPSQSYLDILRQLGAYLQQAQSSSQRQLAPIWRLDMSPLFNTEIAEPGDLSTRSDISSEGESAIPKPDETSLERKSNSKSKALSSAEYVMLPPEYLDVASYTSALASDKYIDHIVCDTHPIDRPQQRQILRITDTPLIHLLEDEAKVASKKMELKPKMFKHPVEVAYNLIKLLSDAERAVVNEDISAKAQ